MAVDPNIWWYPILLKSHLVVVYIVLDVFIWVASFLNLGGRDIKGIMISGQVSLNRPVKTVHLIPSLMTPEHTWNVIAMITPILEKNIQETSSKHLPRDI